MFRRHGSFCLQSTNGEPMGAPPAAAPVEAKAAPAPVAPATAASATVPDAPKTNPATPAAKDDKAEPEWLQPRLERERAKVLKDLGVENPDDAKKALAEHKARLDAAKTVEQKNAELAAQLKAKDDEAAQYRVTLAEMTSRMMVGLSEEQKSAVIKLAGDDPAKQLATINALAPTWAKTEADAKAAAAAAAPKIAPNSAPAKTAPQATTATQVNARATYEELSKSNPFEAAAFGLSHVTDVFPSDG